MNYEEYKIENFIVIRRNKFENLLKENKELKYKLREKICFEGHSQFEDLKKNSVSVAKIKEKIEELEEEKECFYSDYAIEERNNKIQVLKELLKGK